MTNKHIKKLAEISIENDTINAPVMDYVLKRLSKKELKTYLSYLKNVITKKKVLVKTSEQLDATFLSELKKLFVGKEVTTEIDPTLGAGIYVKDNDNILDLSFSNYINRTVNSLKNEL